MLLIQLTEAESANPQILAMVQDLLSKQSDNTVVAAGAPAIGLDAPDVGAPPVPQSLPAADALAAHASPQPVAAPAAPPPPIPVPSVAAVAPSPTVPEVPQVSGTPAAPPAPPVPAAPPVSAVPVPPGFVPQPVSAPAGVELDAEGLPWDARIHAGTKRKNADGTWTAKRGLNDPNLVAHVKAQLRATLAAGPTAPAVAAPPVPTPPAAPPVPAGGAPGANPSDPFTEFMQWLSVEMVAGRIDHAKINAAVSAAGLPSVDQLRLRPDLVPFVSQQLGRQQ